MSQNQDLQDGVAIPRGRVTRFARLGSVAACVGLNVLGGGARDILAGRRADWRALALSPGNARRLAEELARMRGAAMKVGQLMSMDAGDLLPPEFAAVLSRLRAEARPMPPRQLKQVLAASWGARWLARFQRFDPRPIAAASIGQVHRAVTKDGRVLAVKVQFPGVRESIDSDVDNVGALVRLSGMLPAGAEIGPLLDAAKAQLHEEADYRAEARALEDFADLLAGEPAFLSPRPDAEFSTGEILAMDFIDSRPLESLETAPQETRDRVAERLFALLFKEMFDWRRMQSDPNLANYRYAEDGDRVVLLDFGAVRRLPDALVASYRDLLRAGAASDRDGLDAAARAIGYLSADTPADQAELVLNLLDAACEPLRMGEVMDFGASDLAARLRDDGMKLGLEAGYREIPPIDALYLHRKFGGLYLLARRLGARVDVRALLEPYL